MMRHAAVLAMLLAGLGASAQRLDETIEVSIVNVDVHVTDRQGKRVTGLTAADFEIRDDGKVQTITNFSEYGGAAAMPAQTTEAAAAAPAPPSRARRSVVLFLEPVTLPVFRAKELFDAIRKALHQTVSRGDQVSLVTFTRALQIRQPFTDDLAAVDRELAQLEREMSGAEGTVLHESAEMREELRKAEQEFEAAIGLVMDVPMAGNTASFPTLSAAKRERFLIRQKTAALESLIQSISGAEGRKIVLMATRRFGRYAGAEYFGGTVPRTHQRELDTADYRSSLIRTANAHGVTIYPLHTEGLAGTGGDHNPTLHNQILMNETSALEEIAEATGGVMAQGSAEIAKTLPRVVEDLASYYSIGYRAPATRKDAARNIVVTAKNPDYVVRARKQFVEKSDATQMKDRVLANLFQKVGGSATPIPFDVALGTIKEDGRNRWTVPLKVKVPIQSLTLQSRGSEHAGEFSVYVATGGVLGVMSEPDRKTQTFRIPAAELQRAQASHFTYELDVSVDQNANRISIGVMDEVGREYNLKRYTLPKRTRE